MNKLDKDMYAYRRILSDSQISLLNHLVKHTYSDFTTPQWSGFKIKKSHKKPSRYVVSKWTSFLLKAKQIFVTPIRAYLVRRRAIKIILAAPLYPRRPTNYAPDVYAQGNDE